jgi:hypothetical protein
MLAALEKLSDREDINMAWKILKNIKTSAKECLDLSMEAS